MRYFFLLISCILSYVSLHVDDFPVKSKADFLCKYYSFKDANPIWQDDADEINSFIRHIVKKEYKEKNKEELLTKALLLIYKNTEDSFEDAVDIKRMSIRRSMSFASVALLSAENNFRSFLNDAELSLDGLNEVNEFYTYKLMLDLIHLLKLEEFPENNDDEYVDIFEQIRNYFQKYQVEIDDSDFIIDFQKIMKIDN